MIEPNTVKIILRKRNIDDEGTMRDLSEHEQIFTACDVFCAFDESDNLFLVNLGGRAYADPHEIDECYIPSRNYERGSHGRDTFTMENPK